MVRVFRRLLLLAAAGLLVSGCLSPTLPLPPPDRPDVSSPDQSGLVRIQGVASPQSEVIALNHGNNVIAGQVLRDSSRYDFTIQGEVGDAIEIWYVEGEDKSPSTTVIVPAPSE